MHGSSTINVNIIGAGNLGLHLSKAFGETANVNVNAIFSRQLKNALAAAAFCEAKAFDKIEQMPAADIIFIASVDSSIVPILEQIKSIEFEKEPMVVHTAGVVPAAIIKPYFSRYGSFYPLQTFSKEKEINWDKIPIIIHANSSDDLSMLDAIGKRLSKTIYELDDEQKEHLHVAAVFANNFANHLIKLSFDYCVKNGIDKSILFPLIEQTSQKALLIGPDAAQTGPAARADQSSVDQHLKLLENIDTYRDIYKTITKSINKDLDV